MEKVIKRIGILTSGGDAPGMNAAIRAVARAAAKKGIECIGIRRGYNGLINGDVLKLGSRTVSKILSSGGTMLHTARCPEFVTEEGIDKAVISCKYMGIDAIVVIGGDGTYRGGKDLSERGIPVIGIPATIDNDIACTEYTIGFDTACNTAVECIDKLRDTMQSHERISVVEVMGRNAGHLAVYVGLAVGAGVVLVPEREFNFDEQVTEAIRKARIDGRHHFIVIVAEGAASAADVGHRLQEEIGIEPRVTILGHIQRGGSPTARDRVMASRMGIQAVEALEQGRYNRLVVLKDGRVNDIDIVEGLDMKKDLDQSMYEACMTITG